MGVADTNAGTGVMLFATMKGNLSRETAYRSASGIGAEMDNHARRSP